IGALNVTPRCVNRSWSSVHGLQGDFGQPIGVSIPKTLLGTDEGHHSIGPVEDIAVVDGGNIADHEAPHPPHGRGIGHVHDSSVVLFSSMTSQPAGKAWLK